MVSGDANNDHRPERRPDPSKSHAVAMPRDQQPEPNFKALVTEEHLPGILITAHALRRFVQRLQPDIPGADQVAGAMERLEDIGSGNRSGPEQGQLNRYRDWMTKHVEPHVLELIRCEGFWATDRPRWSLSRTPSDRYLQVGGMCLFPAVLHGHEIVLTTCTNGRDTTWDIALVRDYTLMPKPFNELQPKQLRPAATVVILRRAWRTRREHSGLVTAFRIERASAIQAVQQENADRQAAFQAAADDWHARRDRAHRVFTERHR
jgi:hypothetical protein